MTEGLPNFYKVSNDLCRGAQPVHEGFVKLRAMGIKSVVSLRSLHTDRLYIRGLGFRYFHIRCCTWRPRLEDVERFLFIVRNSGNHPVFVHCQFGADRTGLMVAAYRIVVQDWDVEAAVKEMVEGPFGFHKIWKDLPEFLGGLRE